jgi:hypothetical protein
MHPLEPDPLSPPSPLPRCVRVVAWVVVGAGVAVRLLDGPSEGGPALAYIDPASGTFIVQAVLGALAAIGVLLKTQWKRIRVAFGRADEPPEDEGEKHDG